MSHENVESLRRGLVAWRKGDTQTLNLLMDELLSPEFELEPLYFDGSYQGRDGILQLWSALGESWEDYQFEIEELTDLGEHVLLVGRVRGRGSGSGVPIDQRVWVLWRFSGQRAVHAKSFASRQEVLEAVGLRE